MLKVLQQTCTIYGESVREKLDVPAEFQKGRGIRDHMTNICWLLEYTKELQKISLCFIDYIKAFDVDHEKLWIVLKEMGVSQHSIVLMHKLYCGQ